MNDEFRSVIARVRQFIQQVHSRSDSFHHPQGLTCGEFDKRFNELACDLFRLQFTHNPVYQRYCKARDVYPDKITDWRHIPAMPTAAFKDFDVTCLQPAQWTTIFLSSTTTGQKPSRHFHNPVSLALYEASLLPWFARHFLPELPAGAAEGNFASATRQANKLPFLILTPTRADAPCSSLVYMLDTVRRVFGSPQSEFFGRTMPDGSWQLDTNALCAVLRNAARTSSAVALLGTAFAFVQLLDYMHTHGLVFTLAHGSRVMETGGYKGRTREIAKSELYGLIRARLGVPESHIVSEYGMCELGSQAYDAVVGSTAGHKRIFRFPHWVQTQIVSPDTGREVAEGQTGLIRVFDLANVFSAVAVQTEDLAVRHANGFELVGRASLAELRGCSLTAV